MRVAALTLILAWLVATSGPEVARAAADASGAGATVPIGPQELMSELTARVLAALNQQSAASRHNTETVSPLVDRLLAPHFDMEYAAQLVLGLHWRSATGDQRRQFALALYQRLLRTYAGAVAQWTADRVKLLPLRADPAALQVTVHTLVTNSRGAPVPVDFRLHQTGAGWKIFDVVVDGVSYVRSYHDDTDAEVSAKGLDAVIARLSEPINGAAEHAASARTSGAH
jgi:phospholipid transport system substrate-binding protein